MLWVRWLVRGLATVVAAYVLLLFHPKPLFAYELHHAGLVLHATRPILTAMRVTLERARLDRRALSAATRETHVFICEPGWLFALSARHKYRAGGVAEALTGQHVFLRESDMEHDRLIGPTGRCRTSSRTKWCTLPTREHWASRPTFAFRSGSMMVTRTMWRATSTWPRRGGGSGPVPVNWTW